MGDNQQLLNLLSLPNVLLDPTKQKEAVTLLCQLINTDSDEPCIVQPSIKLLSSHQPLTRIVVMQLVQRHVTRNPDIMPQATNALLKCAVDPNPAVRRAAVSTLACVPGAAEVSLPVVAAALRDPHPSVQRAAAVACRVLPRTNPHNELDHVDQLYRLIRSEDPLLLHACLTSLETLLAPEGGVVVSRAMVKHFANRSRELPDMALAEVLRLFPRYTPGSDSERLALMNRLDWLLASPHPHLVQAALRVFFHLCSGALAHLRADAVARAAAALCGPGSHGSGPELRQLTLETVQQLGRQHYPAFCPHYRYFLPRPPDGDALSERLLSFLPHLAGPEQAPDIARELSARLPAPRLQTAAARALVRLGRRRPELAAAVADPLVRLCRSGGAAAVAGALTAADLAPLPAAARAQLLSAPLAQLEQLPAPALTRLLPLVGRWGAELEAAPARLRQAVARYGTLDAAGRVALLEATARLLVKRPAELQLTLGRLLELSWRSGGELRRLALQLYAVLATDQARTLLQPRVEECSAALARDDSEGFHTVGIDPAALDAAQQPIGIENGERESGETDIRELEDPGGLTESFTGVVI